MGNCTSSKRKVPIPIPLRKGSSSSNKRVLLDKGKNKINNFKRSLSKEETITTSSPINIIIDSNKIKNKDNNGEESSIISQSKKPKNLIPYSTKLWWF